MGSVAAIALLATLAAEPGISPRFAWPERLAGKRVERRQGQAGAETVRRSALRIERRGAECRLEVAPADAEEERAAADRSDDPELPLVAGADGKFLRLDGLDAWAEERASFEVRIARSRAEAEGARRSAREAAERLAAEAREQWSYQVEAWLGRALELGRPVETTGRIPVAAIPGLEVEQRVVIQARRWVSCAPGGLDQRCLELSLKADAGPDAFRKGLAAAGGKAAKGFEDGALAVELLLVAEPDTLVPWRYALTKRLRLVFAGGGLSVNQVERREREYQWWKG